MHICITSKLQNVKLTHTYVDSHEKLFNMFNMYIMYIILVASYYFNHDSDQFKNLIFTEI